MCRCLYMWVCRDTHVTHLCSHNLRSRHIRQFSPHTHQYLKWMFVCVSKNNSIVWFSDYDTPEHTYYILLIIHDVSRINLSSTEKTKKLLVLMFWLGAIRFPTVSVNFGSQISTFPNTWDEKVIYRWGSSGCPQLLQKYYFSFFQEPHCSMN